MLSGMFRKGMTAVLLAAGVCTSCHPGKTLRFGRTVCDQQQFPEMYLPAPTRPFSAVPPDTALKARFTGGDLNAAYAVGLLEPLAEYIAVQKAAGPQPTVETRLRLLELSQYITRRISLAAMEISAVSSELDCEDEKLTQMADYMRDKESRRETRLTVLSIIAAAISDIVPPFLPSGSERAGNIIAVSSGVAGATLGALILFNEQKVAVEHPRNALRDVWEGKAHTDVFPPLIWYYLMHPNPAAPDSRSLRERLLQRWQRFGQVEEPSNKEKAKLLALYFGDGGDYTTSELYNRAAMYDQLEAYIRLINQDLTHLAASFENLR